MGLEKRGANWYYYRKRREGGRVVSEYIGSGVLAQSFATITADARNRARADWDAQQALQDQDRDLDRQVDQVVQASRVLARAVLLAAGYHRHKGQWRRRRKWKNR